jgi:hypothetical protein
VSKRLSASCRSGISGLDQGEEPGTARRSSGRGSLSVRLATKCMRCKIEPMGLASMCENGVGKLEV